MPGSILVRQLLSASAYLDDNVRIIHVLDHSLPLQSGYVFRTLSIIKTQRELGWEAIAFTTPRYCASGSKTETVNGWVFYRSPPVPALAAQTPIVREFAEMRNTLWALNRLIAEIKPDVLHAHSPVLTALPSLLAGRRHNIPVVYEVRALWEDGAVDHGRNSANSLKYKMSRRIETFALRRADAITTICEGLRSEIIRRGVAESRVTVIPNGVEVARFSTGANSGTDVIDQLALHNKRVIGFIGSFYRYEGLSLLLEAFKLAQQQIPEARLLLVGGGFEDQRLREQAVEMGISDSVIFAGRVPNAEVESYYGAMEILVYPRLQTRLTELVTPLKPLEAMAIGKLVIVSDVGGHKEMVEGNRTGLFFRAGDRESLTQTILYALRNRDQMAQIKQSAFSYVQSKRNWSSLVARYRPVYQSLVTQFQGRAN